MDFHKVRS